jgi:hypothetical protein
VSVYFVGAKSDDECNVFLGCECVPGISDGTILKGHVFSYSIAVMWIVVSFILLTILERSTRVK